MAIYQKYRAKTFEEVISQKHIKEILQSSIKNNSFGHAYIFVGTRGTGKTSLARIFARTINCENEEQVKSKGEPCNECRSCKEALAGSNVDIIELDAASNRGIDEVRSIIESVDFLPSGGRYKVYIIDEIHMMTKEAFNALLKTIEEPPAHAVFIMCTTEFFKLPPTIISRSQVFELKHATINEIVEKMDKVLRDENIKINQSGKEIIAKLGKGSFRDSESILEKVINSSGKNILDENDVTSALGLSSILLIEDLKSKIYSKDLKTLQETLAGEIDDGSVSNLNHQLAESVYLDIVEDFSKNNIDKFRLELFDFLSSLNLKNTVSPKQLYIAKLLNFLKNYINIPNQEYPQIHTATYDSQEEKLPEKKEEIIEKKIVDNPSALLRQRKKVQATNIQNIEEKESLQTEVKHKVRISKIDFLDFIKTKNLFLYRTLMNNDFAIEDNKIIVIVKTKMQRDLFSKPQNKNLIQEFSQKHNTENLQLELQDFENTSKNESIESNKKSKKVEDLSDEDIDKIFKG